MTANQLHSIGGVVTIVGSTLFLAAWATSTLLEEPSVKGVELSRWLAVPAHILLLLGLLRSIWYKRTEQGCGVLSDSYLLSRDSRYSSAT